MYPSQSLLFPPLGGGEIYLHPLVVLPVLVLLVGQLLHPSLALAQVLLGVSKPASSRQAELCSRQADLWIVMWWQNVLYCIVHVHVLQYFQSHIP